MKMNFEYDNLKNRSRNIDVIKGVCVFFIVLGHVNSIGNVELQKIIFSFHVPIFAVISGFLARDYKEGSNKIKFRAFFLKKLKALLIPYYIYVCLYSVYSLYSVYLGNIDWNHFRMMSIDRLIGTDAANIGPVWFLMALFSVQIIDWFIQKYARGQYVYVLVGIVALIWSMYFENIKAPLLLKNAGILLPYFGFGRMLKKGNFFDRKNYIVISLIGLVIMLFTSHFNSIVYFYTCDFGVPVIFLMETFSGCVGILGTLFYIVDKTSNFKWKMMSYAGKESLDIMAIHLYIHMPISIILGFYGIDLEGYLCNSFITILLWSFILFLISFLCGHIFRKIYRRELVKAK